MSDDSMDDQENSIPLLDSNRHEAPSLFKKSKSIWDMQTGEKIRLRKSSLDEQIMRDMQERGDHEEEDDEEKVEATPSAADDVPTYDNDDEGESDNKVLTLQNIEEELNAQLANIHDVIGVSQGIARILLRKYKWNNTLLFEKFYDSADTDAFLRAANVNPQLTNESIEGDCDICTNPRDLIGLACNHKYCMECWVGYLTQKIIDESECEIKCMAPDCKLLFEEDRVIFHLYDPATVIIYQHHLLQNYVDTNRLMKWCPGLNCSNAVKVNCSSQRHAACSCGHRFCFSCGSDSHEPVNCRLLKVWMKNDSDNRESVQWILSNTKDCPMCKAPIEKNGGCMHMTCTNKSCRYEFCWLCMQNWRGHNQAACNRFQPVPDPNREKSLADLERYNHYHSRYLGHQQSLNLEKNLRDQIDAKITQLQEVSDFSKGEVEFLRKAVDALSNCRRTLMWSYVFAYYLERNYMSEIFEQNQQDLQVATEQLSEIMEVKLDYEDLKTLKRTVQDKYRYVEKRRRVLLDYCAQGELDNDWAYSQ